MGKMIEISDSDSLFFQGVPCTTLINDERPFPSNPTQLPLLDIVKEILRHITEKSFEGTECEVESMD